MAKDNQSLGGFLRGHEKETRRIMGGVSDCVYSPKGVSNIDPLRSMANTLTGIVKRGEDLGGYEVVKKTPIEERHDLVVKNLPSEVKTSKRRKSETSREMITNVEAIEMCKEYDLKTGNKPVTNSAYNFRLRNAEESTDLKPRITGSKKLFYKSSVTKWLKSR